MTELSKENQDALEACEVLIRQDVSTLAVAHVVCNIIKHTSNDDECAEFLSHILVAYTNHSYETGYQDGRNATHKIPL